jgi:hypothetical protein
MKSINYKIPHPVIFFISCYSSQLDPDILLRTLLPHTLNMCYYLNMRDQVSHPYKTTGKIVVLCILILHI